MIINQVKQIEVKSDNSFRLVLFSNRTGKTNSQERVKAVVHTIMSLLDAINPLKYTIDSGDRWHEVFQIFSYKSNHSYHGTPGFLKMLSDEKQMFLAVPFLLDKTPGRF